MGSHCRHERSWGRRRPDPPESWAGVWPRPRSSWSPRCRSRWPAMFGLGPGSKATFPSSTLLLGGVVVVGFALCGGGPRAPETSQRLGWLLLISGLLQAISNSGTAYGARALTDPDGSLPVGPVHDLAGVVYLRSGRTAPGACAARPLPDGTSAVSVLGLAHPRQPGRHCAAGLAAATVNGVTNPTVAGTRLPWDAPEWWAWATAGTSAALLVPAVGVTIVGTLVRVARAKSPGTPAAAVAGLRGRGHGRHDPPARH